MKMKKMLALLLAVMMLASVLAGCNKAEQKPAENASGIQTVLPGKLTVATSPDFAPSEFIDASKDGMDKYVGTDMSLARYLAKEMGLEINITPMSFEAAQIAVSTGQADCAISGFAPTEKRAENYNFSTPYQMAPNKGQTTICLASAGDKYKDLPNMTGVKVGVQNSSLQEKLTTEQLPNVQIVYFSDLGTGVMQLRNGDFDVVAVAGGNSDAIIAANPDIALTGFNFEYESDGTVILMKKGNDALTAEINKHLETAKQYFSEWYAEAEELADIGTEVSYDDKGNVIK